MSRVVTNTGTLTAVPSGVNSDHSYYNINNPNNAKTGTSSTSYAQIGLTRGAQAETYVYFDFNTSSIPQNATITSLECSAKVYISNVSSSNISARRCQLFTGSTAIGSSSNVSNSISTLSLDVGSSWERSDLDDLHVRLYAKRANSNTNTNYYFRFYGADLTVEYSYNETYYTVTTSSNVSGLSLSPTSQEYVGGSTATVTITGNMSSALIEDNGTDVTSSVSGSGTSHTYTISSIGADHTVVANVGVQPQKIFTKVNGAWVPVSKVYVKQNGTWKAVGTMYLKGNGAWKS